MIIIIIIIIIIVSMNKYKIIFKENLLNCFYKLRRFISTNIHCTSTPGVGFIKNPSYFFRLKLRKFKKSWNISLGIRTFLRFNYFLNLEIFP